MRFHEVEFYNIIWFEKDQLFTLANSTTGLPIMVSSIEVDYDGFSRIYSQNDLNDARQKGGRYAITPKKLSELLGIG